MSSAASRMTRLVSPTLMPAALIMLVLIVRAEAPRHTGVAAPEATAARPEISLPQAIAVAERTGADTKTPVRAIGARLDTNAHVFRITLLSPTQTREVDVDPATGIVIVLQVPEPDSALRPAELGLVTQIDRAHVDLREAIAAGEKLGGRPIAAGIDRRKGKPVFRIEMIENRRTEIVLVDPGSAKVLSASATNRPPALGSAPSG